MTLPELVTLIGSVGAISGLIIFFFGKKLNDKVASINILKTTKEVEQIELDIESKYAVQVKKWLDDLQEIKQNHDLELLKKNEQIENWHLEYLKVIKEIDQHKIKLDRTNRAMRRLLVKMEVPYWECDSEGKLAYVNGAWLQLFGISNEQAMSEGWLAAIPEEDRESLLSEWNSRVIDQSEGTIEFFVINQITNEKIKLKSVYAMIFDDDYNITKIIGVSIRMDK